METSQVPAYEEELKRAAEILRGSYRLAAFTGAGMSVESGIPPFRGNGGLWSSYDPRLLELDYFNSHPEPCWRTIKEIFYDHFGKAAPNPGHLVLADMEKDGILRNLITQNIDDLHFRAGSRKVIEFHGNSRMLACLGCERKYEAAETDLAILPPKCPKCGGLLKPDFVFFGEMIPTKALEASQRIARETDCMLVIGTTGRGLPRGGPTPHRPFPGRPYHRDQSLALELYRRHHRNSRPPACRGSPPQALGPLAPALTLAVDLRKLEKTPQLSLQLYSA